MKFAICNETFQDWPLDAIWECCARTGYHAVEIAPFTLAGRVTDLGPESRQAIRTGAARHGLEISAIHWVLARTEGFHVTDPDPSVRQRTTHYFLDLVDFCADLGGRFMVVGSPKQRDLKPGVSLEQGLDWAEAVFRPAVRKAEERGVVICFEPLAPAETNFINTADQAIAFTRRLDSRAFQIILDVKAMCSENTPIPSIIRGAAPHLAYFHANDRNLKGPGFGDVDFVPIAAALRDIGYDGYVSVEVFDYTEGPERIAQESLACLRRAFRSAGYNLGT